MKTLVCDVCRKKLDSPVTGLDYFHLAHRDICEACKEDMDRVLKSTIRGKDPFVYTWFNQFVQDSIEKAIQKGKF